MSDENNTKQEETNTKEAKLANIKLALTSFSQKSISYFVLLFCFIFFPIFLLYSSLTIFFETSQENLKQKKLLEMTNNLDYLEKYSNNKRYFHFLLTNISECAQHTESPIKYLKNNIDNLKKQYPNKIEFIVWDKEGKIIKELTDRDGFSYVLMKLYESLKEVTKISKIDSFVKVSNIEIVKKNINIFRKYLGKVFIPDNLKFPLNKTGNFGPFITELSNELSYVWYSIKPKISFLCFLSNDLLEDFSGLNKISNFLNKENKEIISGFSILPDISLSSSKFPDKFKADLALALTTFENAGDSVFENERAIIKMSMPQPQIRTFCYLSKLNDDWDFTYKKNFIFGILTSTLLALYCLFGFWFILKKHFFSIKWKLTVLFLFANIAPILVLGFIAKGFFESKRISLKNEIVSDLEKNMREFDDRYRTLLNDYTIKLNNYFDKISQKVGNDPINEEELKTISKIYQDFNCLDLYVIASNSQIVLAKRNEVFSTVRKEFMSSMVEAVLAYANNNFEVKNNNDFFSKMFDPELSEYMRNYIKNFYNVVELVIADMVWVYYNYPFGDKNNYNFNYLTIIIWDKEKFKDLFVRENYKSIYNNIPEADFYLKSNIGSFFYGDNKYKGNVETIFNKNSGMTEKISGYTNHKEQKSIYVCLNGSSLKDWSLLGIYSEDKINKEINILIVQILAGALLSLLLTMIIGHLLSLQFLKPIHNLGKAAIAIGERDFSHRVPIGDKDEFGHLNQVFNRVIEGLEDFQVARIIQESLFPGNNFDVGNFRIFGRSVVMTVLGGDYYDCFKINDEFQGIIIGDVAGHGIPAGLMMAMAKSAVLTASEEVKLDPAALTLRLHKMFYAIKNERLKRMMTFQYFVLNVKTGHFKYTNAGHCFPVIVDGNKSAQYIEYIATPLGIGPKCRCKNQDLDLQEGQSLILYTDGIVEAYNSEGEQYGYPRFLNCLPQNYDSNPETFYWNLYNKVYMQWSEKPDDDLTLILISR